MRPACPACESPSELHTAAPDVNRRVTAEVFHYYRCRSCGLIFLSPVPGDLARYYATGYHHLPASPEKLASSAAPEQYKIDLIRRYVREGRLLEIGPSHGSFAYLAKAAGFEVEAIEMDPACCAFLNEKIGIRTIRSDDIVSALETLGGYDVVALWHVIEHLPDPWRVLAALSSHLRPAGVLVVATPNPDSLQFRIMGRNWPHVDAPRHVTLIPRPLLVQRAEALGLDCVLATTADPGGIGWNRFGWEFYLGNLTQRRPWNTILHGVGRVIAGATHPMENREGLGSAYTVVLRKGKTA